MQNEILKYAENIKGNMVGLLGCIEKQLEEYKKNMSKEDAEKLEAALNDKDLINTVKNQMESIKKHNQRGE